MTKYFFLPEKNGAGVEQSQEIIWSMSFFSKIYIFWGLFSAFICQDSLERRQGRWCAAKGRRLDLNPASRQWGRSLWTWSSTSNYVIHELNCKNVDMSADNQQICGLQKCTKPSEMHHSPPLHRELMQTVSLDVGPEKPDRPLRNTFSNVTTSNSRCCSFVNPHFHISWEDVWVQQQQHLSLPSAARGEAAGWMRALSCRSRFSSGGRDVNGVRWCMRPCVVRVCVCVCGCILNT